MANYNTLGKNFAAKLVDFGLTDKQTAENARMAFQAECGQRSFEVKSIRFGRRTNDGKVSTLTDVLVPRKNETLSPALSLQMVFQELADLPEGFKVTKIEIPESCEEWLAARKSKEELVKA